MNRNEIVLGERYVIHPNFKLMRFDNPDDPGVNSDMDQYAGKTVTPTEISRKSNNWYRVQENEWFWDYRWLDPVDPPTEFTEVQEDEFLNMFKE